MSDTEKLGAALVALEHETRALRAAEAQRDAYRAAVDLIANIPMPFPGERGKAPKLAEALGSAITAARSAQLAANPEGTEPDAADDARIDRAEDDYNASGDEADIRVDMDAAEDERRGPERTCRCTVSVQLAGSDRCDACGGWVSGG